MFGYGILAIAILISGIIFGTLGFSIAMVTAVGKKVNNTQESKVELENN